MKNENEYWEDGKRYAKKFRRCECREKIGDCYVLMCSIIQRGEHFYSYKPGSERIERNSKYFWLTDATRQSVNEAIEKFENTVKEMKGDYTGDEKLIVYAKDAVFFGFDFLCEYVSDSGKKCFMLRENEDLHFMICNLSRFRSDLLNDEEFNNIMFSPTEETIERNPLYKAALRQNYERLKKELRLYYKLATETECTELTELLGIPILPALSEEYNRNYVIDTDTVNYKILSHSGYRILHRPYFGMQGSTHEKIQLNPHTKIGVDAAKIEDESMSFIDFLEIIENAIKH